MTFDMNEKFLFQEKTSATLIFIYRKEVTYISEVSSNIDSTFSHTNKIIKRLEEIGLLSSVFEGRSRFLKLTPRGYFLAKHLSESVDIFRSSHDFVFPEGYLPTRRETKQEESVSEDQASYDFFNYKAPDSSAFVPNSSTVVSDYVSNLSEAPAAKTASSILFDRLRFFGTRIKEIYDELIDAAADPDLILQKLGPFDRELKMIYREIENLNSDDESLPDLMAAYRAAEMQYSFYLGKK